MSSEFTLLHCGRPMRFRGSVTQQRGGPADQSATTSARYACDRCRATLETHLTEPEDAGVAPG